MALMAQVRAFLTQSATDGHILIHPRGETTFHALYNLYKTWNTERLAPVGPNPFGTVLTALGFPSRKGTNGVRMRTGIQLKQF